jgi:hypothetical protein
MTNLMGSASSLESAQRLLADYFYTNPSKIVLDLLTPRVWRIRNGEKYIEGLSVRLKQGRFRIEKDATK